MQFIFRAKSGSASLVRYIYIYGLVVTKKCFRSEAEEEDEKCHKELISPRLLVLVLFFSLPACLTRRRKVTVLSLYLLNGFQPEQPVVQE